MNTTKSEPCGTERAGEARGVALLAVLFALTLLMMLALPFAARGQANCGRPTPADIEGPFYKPGAPARASLAEPGSTSVSIGKELPRRYLQRFFSFRLPQDPDFGFWSNSSLAAY